MKTKFNPIKRRMDNPIYYRSLYSPKMISEWNKGINKSTHKIAPWEWVNLWRNTQSLNAEEYLLDNSNGLSTEEARIHFLNVAKKYKAGSVWLEEDLLKVGEVDCVFAFDNPYSAYEYAKNSLFGDSSKVAVFSGKYVCECSPEEEDGAVCVRRDFIKDEVISLINFRERYLDQLK